MIEPDTNVHPHRVPVAFWAVVILVLACVGTAVLLVPSESDLLGRLTIDGKIERIREIVTEKIGHDPSSRELLEQGAAMLADDGWDANDTAAMELLAANACDVAESFAAIRDIGDGIPAESAEAIYTKMANTALAENRPKLAAEIFARLGAGSGLSAEQTTRIATSLRACSEPGAMSSDVGKPSRRRIRRSTSWRGRSQRASMRWCSHRGSISHRPTSTHSTAPTQRTAAPSRPCLTSRAATLKAQATCRNYGNRGLQVGAPSNPVIDS